MCLSKLSKTKLSKNDNGIGYKVFERHGCTLRTPYLGVRVTLAKWQNSVQANISSDRADSYLSGFHIFKTSDNIGAENWLQACGDYGQLWKVEYKDVIAHGTESGVKVIVAKRMKLIRQIT